MTELYPKEGFVFTKNEKSNAIKDETEIKVIKYHFWITFIFN